MDRATLEKWLVIAIAVHSYAIGVVMLAAPVWGARFGGFGEVNQAFFVRQAGAFHVVVATGYLAEYFRHRTNTLLFTAKSIAVLFLLGITFAGGAPWPIPISAAGDAAMAALVFVVRPRR